MPVFCLSLAFACPILSGQKEICNVRDYLRTHKFVRKLQEAGFDEKQAEGLTDAMCAALDESELVTKKDLQIELSPIKADLNLLKWMMGALIAIAVANFAKQFFLMAR